MHTVAMNTQHGFHIMFSRLKSLEMEVVKLKNQDDEWRLKFKKLGSFLHEKFGFNFGKETLVVVDDSSRVEKEGGGDEQVVKQKETKEAPQVNVDRTKVVMDRSNNKNNPVKSPVLNLEHLYPNIEVKKLDGIISTNKIRQQGLSTSFVQEKKQQSSCSSTKSKSSAVKESINGESCDIIEVIDIDIDEPVNNVKSQQIPTVIVEPQNPRSKITIGNEKATVKDKTTTVKDDLIFLEKILPFSIIKPLEVKQKGTPSQSSTHCSPPKLNVVTPLKRCPKPEESLQKDQNFVMHSPSLSPPVLTPPPAKIDKILTPPPAKIVKKTVVPSCRKCKADFTTRKERTAHKKLCGKVYNRGKQETRVKNNSNNNNNDNNLTAERATTKIKKTKIIVTFNKTVNHPHAAASKIVEGPIGNSESHSPSSKSVEIEELDLEEVEELRTNKRDNSGLMNYNSTEELSKCDLKETSQEQQSVSVQSNNIIISIIGRNTQQTDFISQGLLRKVTGLFGYQCSICETKFKHREVAISHLKELHKNHNSELNSPIRSDPEIELGRLEDFENIPLVTETWSGDESNNNMDKIPSPQLNRKIKSGNTKETECQNAEISNSNIGNKANNHNNNTDSNDKGNDQKTVNKPQKEVEKEKRKEIAPEEMQKNRSRKQLLIPNKFMYNGFTEEVKTQQMWINQKVEEDKPKRRRQRCLTTKPSTSNSSTTTGKKRKRSLSISCNKQTESFNFKSNVV